MRERWIMGAELRWLSGWWNFGEVMAVWQCVGEWCAVSLVVENS